MEKNFTLMKTLTAFLHLLFPASRKNARAVHKDQPSGKRCSTATAVENKSTDMNDAKHDDASFLFFEKTAIVDQPSTTDNPATISDEQKLKNTEELRKVNDEMALRSAPLHNNWKHRVNDDLAACVTVGRESAVVSRESITVIDNPIKSIVPAIIVNDETRTNKNDAWLPFASFCFSDLFQSISQLFYEIAGLFENRRPVLLTIPIRSGQTGKPNYNAGTKL